MNLRNLDDKIVGAPNFKYRDFVKSNTALRLTIINIPNEEQWQRIEELAVFFLQPIRNRFGRIRVSSGFRSIELCEKIGSNKYSNHAKGQAVDFEPMESGVSLIEVMEWIVDNLEYRELIAEYFPDGWIHGAFRRENNARIIKLKDVDHSYEIVSFNTIKNIYSK